MRLLWLLLPDSALPLVIMVVALLLIAGVIRWRMALSLVGVVLLYVLFSPFVGVVLDLLPGWVSPLLLVVFVMSVLRAASSLMLGERSTDHLVALLAADVIRCLFRALLFPFRLLGRLARPY